MSVRLTGAVGMRQWIVGKKAFLTVNDTAVQAIHGNIFLGKTMPNLVVHQALSSSYVVDCNFAQ